MAVTQRIKTLPRLAAGPQTRPLSRTLLRWAIRACEFVLYSSIVAIFVVPLIWMLFGSLRRETEIFQYIYPLSWNTFIPIEWTLKNYLDVLGLSEEGRRFGLDFGRTIFNTAFVSAAVVACSLIFNTAAAYFFARLHFPGKDLLFVFVLTTMLIPFEATIVPLYLVVRWLNMQDSYAALIVPWYASPFIIFALRQFFEEIPKELDEAAIIDGASAWQILFKIIVPNAVPGLITMALLEFQFIWNLFFWPLVSIADKNIQVLQVAIQSQTNQTQVYWGRTLAGSVLATLPVVIIFLRLQGYYVKGVVMRGLKG